MLDSTNPNDFEHKTDDETTGEDIQAILDSPVDTEEPLVDDGVFEADAAQSKVPIYKSIPLKAGLAGVVAFFLLIPTLILFSGNLISANKDTTSTEASIAEPEETEEAIALRESEQTNANLRRQLALQNQGFTAAEMDKEAEVSQSQEAAQDETTPVAQRPTPTAARPAPVTSSPTSIRTMPPPPPRRVATRPPAPIRQATPLPARTIIPSPSAPSRSSGLTHLNTADLSNNGNYGTLPAVETASVSFSSTGEPFTASAATLVSRTIPISVAQTKETSASQSSRPTKRRRQRRLPATQERSLQESDISGADSQPAAVEVAASYEEERALILGDTAPVESPPALPLTIAPGSLAQGQLSQPISWTRDMSSIKGALTLTDPLMSSGYEVLPAGTEIIVEVANFSESGAVELRPTAIVLSQASTLDLSIPLDAIQILAADGGYPIAQIENGSEQALRRLDRQQAVLGALSGAARFINRPDSESGFFGAGGSTYNRDYGDGGSVIAAIGGGAADEILDSRSQRLAAQSARIAQRPYIWTLPTGTDVQLFISQEVRL